MTDENEVLEEMEDYDIGHVGDEIDLLAEALPNDDLSKPKVEPEEKGEKEQEPPSEKQEEPEEKEEPQEKIEETANPSEIEGLKAGIAAIRREKQALQAQIDAIKQNQPIQQPEKIDLFEEPEKRLGQLENNITQTLDNKFLNYSVYHCKARHPDYDEKEAQFIQMAQANPYLVQQMNMQPDPAEWAYQQVTQQQIQQEIGSDPNAYRERLKAEIRQELLAEEQNKIENKIQKLSGLPPSANSIPSAGSNQNKPTILDDPLGAVLGDR